MLQTVLLAAVFTLPEPCGVHGRVTDGSGQPVSAARVEVVSGRDGPLPVDRHGAFCLPPFFATARLQLLVTADGYQDQLSPPFDVRPGLDATVDIVLTKNFAERITVTGRADSLVGIS